MSEAIQGRFKTTSFKSRNRRRKTRRHAGHVIKKTVETLQVLERISRGGYVDFAEHYAEFVRLKEGLGRRREDRRLGDALCTTIEAIANNLARLFPMQKGNRKVSIKRISGEMDSRIKIVGWEESFPRVGKSYRVLMVDGGLYSTCSVTRIAPGYIQTHNCVYQIEVLDEKRY